MQVNVKGYIIFNKIEKDFEGTDCNTAYLEDAFIYDIKNDAEETIKEYDEPENYEIWEVEKSVKTV